jgi:hypothetical protein
MAIPNALDLLAAVRHFVEQDVLPDLKGRKAFHAKVAANVLAMLEREIRVQPLDVERRAFADLLGQDGSAKQLRHRVSAQLRDGRLDETSPGLFAALRTVALARLAADNPKYSTYQRLTQPQEPRE